MLRHPGATRRTAGCSLNCGDDFWTRPRSPAFFQKCERRFRNQTTSLTHGWRTRSAGCGWTIRPQSCCLATRTAGSSSFRSFMGSRQRSGRSFGHSRPTTHGRPAPCDRPRQPTHGMPPWALARWHVGCGVDTPSLFRAYSGRVSRCRVDLGYFHLHRARKRLRSTFLWLTDVSEPPTLFSVRRPL